MDVSRFRKARKELKEIKAKRTDYMFNCPKSERDADFYEFMQELAEDIKLLEHNLLVWASAIARGTYR